jgi:hypothetical protein
VNLNTDVSNCGACDSICNGTTNGTTTCDQGVCTQHCSTNFHSCGPAVCASDTDATLCGPSCQACGSGQKCFNGACATPNCQRVMCGGSDGAGGFCIDTSGTCVGNLRCVGSSCRCVAPNLICPDGSCLQCCSDADCAGNQQCVSGTCSAINCTPCQTAIGHACQQKAAGESCGPGMECTVTGVCIVCGLENQLCCPLNLTCNGSDLRCVVQGNSAGCVACGHVGQLCCDNGVCNEDPNLVACLVPAQGGSATCMACGGFLQRCCNAGSGCQAGLVCTPVVGQPSHCDVPP